MLLGLAAACRERLGTPAYPDEQISLERETASVRAALGDDAFTRAWTKGRALSLDEEIAKWLPAGDDLAGA